MKPAVILAVLLLAPLTTWHTASAPVGERESLSLDGTWQIVFDRDNQGGAKQWVREKSFPRDQQREIAVPRCWELVEKDYEGVACYRRTFKLPKSWRGKVVRVRFDAVNFRAEVWLNDTAVGFHEGGFAPFEFRVDDLLKFHGENTLILRVVRPILMQNKRVDDLGPMETPQWRGAITGDVYVKGVFIEPRLSDDSATFHTELEHGGEKTVSAKVEITIRSGDQTVAQTSEASPLKPGPTKQSWTLKIPRAVHWSPDNPHLYSVVARMSCGDVASDVWTTRFGMREFIIRDKRLYLNGKPLYLKATFFEGLYPVNLAYPDSREMVIREIRLVENLGKDPVADKILFNLVERIHAR
jgi:beta-galactosidase/beta-glucuronidase